MHETLTTSPSLPKNDRLLRRTRLADREPRPFAFLDHIEDADEDQLPVLLQELIKTDKDKKNLLPDELLNTLFSRSLTAYCWIPENHPEDPSYSIGGLEESIFRHHIYPKLVEAFIEGTQAPTDSAFYERALQSLQKIDPSIIDHIQPLKLAKGLVQRLSPKVFGKLCWETMQELEIGPIDKDDSDFLNRQYRVDSFWKKIFQEVLFLSGDTALQNAYSEELAARIDTRDKAAIRDTIHALSNTFQFHRLNSQFAAQHRKDIQRILGIIREHSQQSSFVDLYLDKLQQRFKSGRKAESTSYAKSDSFIPFQIAPQQYGCIVTHNGKRKLLVSLEADFDEITTSLKELKKIETDLIPVRRRLGKIDERFGHIDRDNWPYNIYDEKMRLYDQLKPYNTCLHKIRTYFFEGDTPDQASSAMFSNEPRHNRVIADENSPYIELYSEEMRPILETTYGFSIDKLTLREQRYFMDYLMTTPTSQIEEIQQFVKTYGVTGIRTFLSLEHGGQEMGSAILKIAESLPVGAANEIFNKYTELADAAQNFESWLAQNFKKGVPPEQITTLASQMFDRGKNLLISFSQKALMLKQSQGRYKKNGGPLEKDLPVNQGKNQELHGEVGIIDRTLDDNYSIITAELERLNVEQITLLQTFKTLKENGVAIALDDFNHSSFLNVHGSELPETEVPQMRSLYAESMAGYPQEIRDRLINEFYAHLEDTASTFRVFRYKGEIAGFMCFTETKPGQKYLSAVTLDPRFQKAYIGEAMIDEALTQEAERNAIGADCVARKSVSARYIENGFIGVKSWDDKGDLIMDIIRDDRRNEQYFETKRLTQEEIVKLAPLGKIGEAQIITVTNPQEHDFTLCNTGFVLTRYFKDAKTKQWYLVYEPRPALEKNPGAQKQLAKELTEA